MKNFSIVFMICITAISLLLTSCCKLPTTQNAKAPITLQTVSMLAESDTTHEAYQNLLADFQTANTNIKIEDKSDVSTEPWKQSVVDSFASDETTPDVIYYFIGSDVRQLIVQDEFVSIEEIREVYPEYAQNIRPSVQSFTQEFDGNHYSVPIKGFWEGLFCNTDLFASYNLPLPTDWEKLTRAVEVFARNDVTPIAASLSEAPHYWIEHTILAQGGAIEHRLNLNGYVLDSWILGLKELKKLYNLGAFPPNTMNSTDVDSIKMFTNKEAAMILGGSWISASITDKENTIVLPIPQTPTGQKQYTDIISGFSSGFYISRKAWNDPIKRNEAVKLVMHMSTNESIAYMCTAGGAPTVDVQSDGQATKLEESERALQANAKTAIMPIDSRLDKNAWQYLCTQIEQIMLDKITIEEVVQKVAEKNTWQ